MSWIGWIPARGGSKGVPRKALADLGGAPLIAWTIRDALDAAGFDRVIVSTDDAEIADVARVWGAEVLGLRPARLAGDEANLTHALEHTLAQLDATEVVCVLSPTNPFRRADRLTGALQRMRAEPELGCLRTMAPSTLHPADCVMLDEQGRVRPFTHQGQPIPRIGPVAFESLSFNLFSLDSSGPGQRSEVVLLDEIEGTDIDEPQDLLRARAIVAVGRNPQPAPLPREQPVG